MYIVWYTYNIIIFDCVYQISLGFYAGLKPMALGQTWSGEEKEKRGRKKRQERKNRRKSVTRSVVPDAPLLVTLMRAIQLVL